MTALTTGRSPAPAQEGSGQPQTAHDETRRGQILASPLTHTTGAHGQTLAIHRYVDRIAELDDSNWPSHGHAWLCHTCRTVSGSARQKYTPTLHAAERHVCPRKGDR